MTEGERPGTPEGAEEEYNNVNSLDFTEVQKGSIILVHTGYPTDEVKETPNFRIKVTGVKKNGLRVLVYRFYPGGMQGVFTATMQGSSIEDTPGVSNGMLKVADEHGSDTLHFRGLKGLGGEPMARSMRTSPIQEILFKR